MKAKTNFAIVKQIIVLFALTVCISSCSSLFTSQGTLMKVEKGMSKNDVAKLLGTPDYRRFNHDLEEWEYRRTVVPSGNSVIIVYFSGDRVVSMDSFEDNVPQTPVVQVSPVPPYYPQPQVYTRGMHERDFAGLLAKIKNEPFKDDKFSLLKLAADNNSFTCRQCVRLMSVFTFDDEKLQVVQIVGRQIVDKENYKEVVDALSFLSSKEKAERMLGIPSR